MDRFALVKWYLDCVDGAGRSAIVYSSTLKWGPARVNWHAVSLHEPGRDAVHRSSVAAIPMPGLEGGRLIWRARPLGCTVACTPSLAPFSQRLIDLPDGALDWRCEVPSASVAVTLANRQALAGRGYAECLEVTVPPWHLPIEELRWGRWLSDEGSRSVVWIDWKGPHTRTDVYVDGRRQAGAIVRDSRIEAGGLTLELSDRRTLHSRSLSSALAGLSHVLSLLPASWRGVDDTKWISRACLGRPGAPPEEGWCIDELLRFPR